jgi:hypothetical protein
MVRLKQTETFRNWERKLKDRQVRATIAARLFRLANGLARDTAPVGRGICELRIHSGQAIGSISSGAAMPSSFCSAVATRALKNGTWKRPNKLLIN